MNRLLPTTLVGSYAQPDWLIDREKLAGRFPPRVRAKELWRVAPEHLEAARDSFKLNCPNCHCAYDTRVLGHAPTRRKYMAATWEPTV